jgi:hypothetical protein
MEVEVRTGVVDDFHEVMRLAVDATQENAFIAPDMAKLAMPIYGVLTKQIPGIIGVIGEVGGKLEGAILLNIGEMWYSKEQIIEEKAIFVDPEYRAAKGGRARKLAEFAKRVSDDTGLPLSIGVLSNSRTAAKMRLYERVFGEPAGVYFLYGAKTGIACET